jgi:hypothetical protein
VLITAYFLLFWLDPSVSTEAEPLIEATAAAAANAEIASETVAATMAQATIAVSVVVDDF